MLTPLNHKRVSNYRWIYEKINDLFSVEKKIPLNPEALKLRFTIICYKLYLARPIFAISPTHTTTLMNWMHLKWAQCTKLAIVHPYMKECVCVFWSMIGLGRALHLGQGPGRVRGACMLCQTQPTQVRSHCSGLGLPFRPWAVPWPSLLAQLLMVHGTDLNIRKDPAWTNMFSTKDFCVNGLDSSPSSMSIS
eukprot:TRINITY_DN6511_c0_g2_i1.p1 TRINITY_DN6511_c0_g2~~TRINITY_DN6511_c0_g2_i1.p1  ORF type:complete len:216 (-),score=-1.91 TRINITY_DN6511_c0_g2_i1:190-765(-)